MLVVGFPAGPFGTNCFLAADGAGSECVVIDPGMDALPGIEEAVREHRLRPAAVLLTHGHLDHTWSVYPVCSGYGIPGYIHPQDAGQLQRSAERRLGADGHGAAAHDRRPDAPHRA